MPLKLKNKIFNNKANFICRLRDMHCKGKIEQHHNFYYAGKQIQEEWAIISLCEHHHSLVKTPEIRKKLAWIGLNRLFNLNNNELKEQEKKYSKVFLDWKRQVIFLNKIYGRYKKT